MQTRIQAEEVKNYYDQIYTCSSAIPSIAQWDDIKMVRLVQSEALSRTDKDWLNTTAMNAFSEDYCTGNTSVISFGGGNPWVWE